MVVPTVTSFFQAVMVSLAAAMMALLSFIPALIGAVIILVVGWLLSDFIGALCVRILDRVGFEAAAQRTGVSGFISQTGMRDPRASVVLAELVKWFIRLIFLEAAAEAVHLQAVVQVINQIILFIPNLIVALVVLMIGVMVARLVAGLVRGSAAEAGFDNPNLLAGVAKYAIMAFAVLIAVNQIGIAASLVNAMFIAFVGALALALGLAFGLGGRDVAGRMWQNVYERGRSVAPRLEQKAQQAAAQQTSPAAARQADVEYGGGEAAYPRRDAGQGFDQPDDQPPQRRTRMRPTIE